MGLVSTARSNSSKRSGTFLWHLVRKQWVKVCVTVRTVWMNKKHKNTDPRLAQHCTLDKTDQQRDSCPVPRVLRSVCSKGCASVTATHMLNWSFPYQEEMPSEIRTVTDANWVGELEGLRSTSCGWIYFGDHLLETYSSTQQIVALSTAQSEYISITKGMLWRFGVPCWNMG